MQPQPPVSRVPAQNPHAKQEPIHLQHWAARKEQILAKLPAGIKPERFESMMRTAFYENFQTFSRSTPESFLFAVAAAAELGLMISKTAGHAYLVPYKGAVQLIVGYKGLIFLAARAGILSQAEAHAVYGGQEFLYYMENNEWKSRHVPFGETSTKDDNITHVYGILTLTNGSKKFDCLTRDQIETVRGKAPSANSPAWRDSWGEMAKKTVLRRMFKTLPVDPECELMRALHIDDEPETPKPIEPPKSYMNVLKETSYMDMQRIEAAEVNDSREVLAKSLEILWNKGIDLGKKPADVANLSNEEVKSLLLKTEEYLEKD